MGLDSTGPISERSGSINQVNTLDGSESSSGSRQGQFEFMVDLSDTSFYSMEP